MKAGRGSSALQDVGQVLGALPWSEKGANRVDF
jgi:hypothetical protein